MMFTPSAGAQRYRNPDEDLPADSKKFGAWDQNLMTDPNLQPTLTRPINWDLIRQQYDQMIKYATALRLGTAETEAILRRFTRNNLKHPTYQALAELGKADKTIFLCRYGAFNLNLNERLLIEPLSQKRKIGR